MWEEISSVQLLCKGLSIVYLKNNSFFIHFIEKECNTIQYILIKFYSFPPPPISLAPSHLLNATPFSISLESKQEK